MSELVSTPLGAIQRVLVEEFRTIPHGLSYPADRIEHLFVAVKARKRSLKFTVEK